MKVVTILGSPRKKGNTAVVLDWVEEELRSKGHEVDHVSIIDYKVNGCIECFTCEEFPDEPGCPQEDEAVAIFHRMKAADAILYASPLFCWGWSGQIKPLIDRHYCLVTGPGTEEWKSFLDGKRTGLLVTAAGPEEENADLIVESFKRLSDYIRTRMVARLVVPYCTAPDALGDDVRQKAVKLATELVRNA